MVDRKAYTAFIRSRAELRQARLALSRISAQDEFAKWAKQRRLADKLQSEFDVASTHICGVSPFTRCCADSARSRRHAILVFAIGWIARAAIYVVLLAANWRFVDYSLMPVPKDFVRSERIVELLSFPYSPKGSLVMDSFHKAP